MLEEFKKFAMRGNVMDLAVGVIIGGAFGKIITSLVNDVIMPLISLLLGKISFVNLFLALDGNTYKTIEDAQAVGVATLNYGMFIQAIIDFVIVAFIIFLLVKAMNKMKKEEAPAPAPMTKECLFCAMQVPLTATRCPHCTSQL